jgi:hypothetical protein
MSPLHWQESPSTSEQHTASQPPTGLLGLIVGIMSGAAFSFLLMGLIAGYILGSPIR